MPEVSAYISAPFQGVSQASPQIALATQAQTLDNVWVDIPEGARKRPPLTWLKKLFDAGVLVDDAQYVTFEDPDDSSLVHLILNREAGSVVPYLFSSSLAPVTVTVDPDAQTYLDLETPSNLVDDLRVSQVVDDTIITNRLSTVAIQATTNPDRNPEAIIFVKAGAYGRKFTLTITPSGGSPIYGEVVTPSGDNADDSFHVGTDAIAYAFLNAVAYPHNGFSQTRIDAALTAAGISYTLIGPVIYLTSATDFTLISTDDSGGLGMGTIKGKANKFSDLPSHAIDGFTVEISPVSKDNQTGGYWVAYDGDPTTGIWKEVLAPGSELGLDPATMPVVLNKDGGTWNLKPTDWKSRTVGSETLLIDPGFVGKVIHDVGYTFGRLSIISSEEIFLTAADDPFRCYPASAATSIDSDPISFQPPGSGRANYRAIVNFKDKAVVIGREQQTLLVAPGDGPVTPTTVKPRGLSDFEITDEVPLRPVGSNGRVYFSAPRGSDFVSVYELATDRVSGQDATEDLAPAIPRLLPNTLDRACGVQTSYCTLYGSSGDNALYAHFFRFNDQQRVQNGWFPMTLPEGWTLNGLSNKGTQMFVLAKDPAGVAHLASMEAAPKDLDSAAAAILTNWDMRLRDTHVSSEVYNSISDTTVITAPAGYSFTSLTMVSAMQMSPPVLPEGYLAEIISQTPTTITVRRNWTGQDYWVGYAYVSQWTPFEIQYVSPNDDRPMHSGVLRIDAIWADLARTGFLLGGVSIGSRSSASYTPQALLTGDPPLRTGPWRFPVGGLAHDTIISFASASHMPFHCIGFEWTGDYNPRARRVT